MKLTLSPSDLNQAAADAARIAPQRHYSPILAGVRINASDKSRVAFSAYDLERGITSLAAGDITEPGEVVVSAKLLAAISKALPKSKPATLTADDRALDIACGGSRYSLPAMALAEYPVLPAPGSRSGTLPASVFVAAVQKAAVASLHEKMDALANLTAIYIEAEGNTLKFTATDRYRLSSQRVEWENHGEDWTALVPADALIDVAKAVESEPTVTLHRSDANFAVSTGTVAATLPYIDGTYPAYEKLIPKEYTTQTVLDSKALSDALGRALLTADPKGLMVMELSEAGVKLSATQDGFGSGTEKLPAIAHVGEDVTMKIRGPYLKAAIGALADSRLTICVVTNRKPIMLLPGAHTDLTQPDTDYRHLVMPVAM